MKDQYTIAIASDIHSNLTAFTTWIDLILKQDVDEVYLLGDYVSDFPNPQDTLDALYELSNNIPTTCIRGNREDYFLHPDPLWCPSTKSGSLYHTNKQLRSHDLSFFSSLPISKRCVFQDAPSIILAHGSPNDNCQHLTAGSMEVTCCLHTMQEDFLIAGHTHRPCIEIQKGKCYINPGSIGYSVVSTKGSYATMTYHNHTWNPQLHFFSYDYQKEQRRIIKTNFLADAHYWGVCSWLNLQTGTDLTFKFLTEAYRISNNQPPLEQHFIKAANKLHLPTIDEVIQQTE